MEFLHSMFWVGASGFGLFRKADFKSESFWDVKFGSGFLQAVKKTDAHRGSSHKARNAAIGIFVAILKGKFFFPFAICVSPLLSVVPLI
jgi:hypothetical protein